MNGNGEKGKRILMFCVSFFGYEKRLENALKSCGYEVDLYDERPSNGFFGKTFIRLGFKLYRPVVKKYIERIIAENRAKDYDYILIDAPPTLGGWVMNIMCASDFIVIPVNACIEDNLLIFSGCFRFGNDAAAD